MTTTRPAREGEFCDCGDPARVVYVTERHGDVPFCGVQHRTAEEEPGERVVVIPEVTVSLRSQQARARVLDLVAELRPRIEELHAEAIKVRDDSDAILVELFPIFGDVTDEMHELADRATGWDQVWESCRWIGDLFDDSRVGGFATTGLERHEIARGGERDFRPGTTATIPRPDGEGTMRVEVWIGPWASITDGGYFVRDVETGQQYRTTHEELRAGVEVDAEVGR